MVADDARDRAGPTASVAGAVRCSHPADSAEVHGHSPDFPRSSFRLMHSRGPLVYRPAMRRLRTLTGHRWLGMPVADLVLGAVLATVAAIATARQPTVLHPWEELVSAAAAGSLVLRTRAPLTMAGCAAAAMLVLAALPGASTPLWAFVTLLILAFSAGAHLAGRSALLGLGMLLVAGYVLNAVTDPDAVERLFTPLILVGAPALAGLLLRRSRLQAAALHRLAAELAAEQELHAEAVALAERTRIARELHDVIAHSVSVMVVQAGAAEQLMHDGDPALGHVRAVRNAGRDALAELRRSLGLLRRDTSGPPVPQPTLTELAALAADAGATLDTLGAAPDDAAPGLQLTAYRIVQEALTNARRHAPGAAVHVHVDYTDPASVRIQVADEGTRPGQDRRPASGDARPGHGLIGMAERAALFGGTVVAGPRPDGPGWRVEAALPLRVADREVLAR